jgi:hypothetical protein
MADGPDPVGRRATRSAVLPVVGGLVQAVHRRVFGSRLHTERAAALLGAALGVTFTVCFVTGLLSHVAQGRGAGGVNALWPSAPADLYRVTQGVHVVTGIASIPLLLAKLWVVYPHLWAWPPLRNPLHAVERVGLAALVGGAVFQLGTGVMNIFYWYAFPFNFTNAHYAGSYIAIGGLVLHVGAKWEVSRRALRRDGSQAPERPGLGLSRRALFTVVGAAATALAATVLGSMVRPLGSLAILAPRRAGDGPDGLPVNHPASAQVRAAVQSPEWRLAVDGNVPRPFVLTLDDLRSLPTRDERLTIACVEGWSTAADWRGVSVRDLLDRAGAAEEAVVVVHSVQEGSPFAVSRLEANHTGDRRTLLALELNGGPLSLDHGFPTRLIAPNRPGVLQTKWVHRLEIL